MLLLFWCWVQKPWSPASCDQGKALENYLNQLKMADGWRVRKHLREWGKGTTGICVCGEGTTGIWVCGEGPTGIWACGEGTTGILFWEEGWKVQTPPWRMKQWLLRFHVQFPCSACIISNFLLNQVWSLNSSLLYPFTKCCHARHSECLSLVGNTLQRHQIPCSATLSGIFTS